MRRCCMLGLFLFLLLTGKMTAAPSQNEWRIGGGANCYAQAGNLTDSPGVDWEIFTHHSDTTGGLWRVSVSRFEQYQTMDNQLPYVRVINAWLLRGFSIQWKEFNLIWLTGLGIGPYIEHRDGRSILLGSLGFQSEILIPINLIGDWNMEFGLTYSGSMIPNTDRYIDRIGLVGFIIGSPF
ncbi:MAG: hypothetical protein P9M15_04820 [Candidatus Electryoneaceae bacterium]|nr:hypothetical protein [Candidatus Electryoneaceae bacterium]